MQFYLDEENNLDNFSYSYDTFECSLGGKPIFVSKKEFHLIIPVLNKGIYDLKSFNNGNETPFYVDRSYYVFNTIASYLELISIREGNIFKGNFENTFTYETDISEAKPYYIELEMGYNGNFIYGATWKINAASFGVLIPSNSQMHEDSSKYYRKLDELNTQDLNFLLNREQLELNNFINQLT